MIVSADAKQVQKRSSTTTEIPTVAPSDDHTDGTWSDLDIYSGEFFANEADGKLFIRLDATIKEIALGSGDTIYTGDDTIGSGRVVTLTDTLRIEDGAFIVKGGSGDDIVLFEDSSGADAFKIDSTGLITMFGEDFAFFSSGGGRFDIGDTLRRNVLQGTSTTINTETRTPAIRGTAAPNTKITFGSGGQLFNTPGGEGAPLTHFDFNTVIAPLSGSMLFSFSSGGTQRIVMDGNGDTIFGPGTVNASAIVEIESTTKALRLRPMTAAQASLIATAEGLILVVSSTDATFTSVGFWGFENGAWAKL